MTKKIDPAAIYVCDMTAGFPEGYTEFGERRRGSDPVVKAHPECFLPDGASLNELRAHAGQRHEAAAAASQAAAAARQADEAAHGPAHLTKAEGGSQNA